MSVHELQAPARSGATLIHPPLSRAADLIARNSAGLSGPDTKIAGRPLAEVRAQARLDVWRQIQEYYSEADEPLPSGPTATWIVAGHQPELFHAGVWLKNFAIQGLARRLEGTALNLLVDNDLAPQPALSVPAGERIAVLPFDEGHGEAPYEERSIQDADLFRRFPQEVDKLTAAWPFRPLLPDFWIDMALAVERTRNLGECVARARRAWERRFGASPVELPVSRFCRTEAFALFAAELLGRAAAFRSTYNGAVAEYRQRYGLRSVNHPVPDLAAEGEWVEAPFWGWRAGAARRGRLFARPAADGLELRCDRDAWPTLTGREPAALALSFRHLEEAGYKVRPRALSLTLLTRLCLADLFVHGLGGGKYDEVTDQLLHRFFHIGPPRYLVATGTLYLPFPEIQTQADDHRRLRWKVRDLEFNPQRHISSGARLSRRDQELLLTKAVLIRHEPRRHKERKDRFFQIRQLNEELQPLVASQRNAAEAEDARLARRLAEQSVAQRRDYSFCLYPEEALTGFLTPHLRGGPADDTPLPPAGSTSA